MGKIYLSEYKQVRRLLTLKWANWGKISLQGLGKVGENA
jgi:hypothetical protein